MTGWSEVARAVARGECHWSALREAGFDASRTQAGWEFGPWENAPLNVARDDVVQGITQHRQSPEKAQEWASFLLAAGVYALDDEEVIDALWKLSFGDVAADVALERLR